MQRQLRREDYTVGWVCALPVELVAAQEMLDEEHLDLEHDTADSDENLYALGSIGGHNVAIVCLPAGRIGNNPAAAVATQMRATFKNMWFGLMVGIGGGVPSAGADVRLGDVVVSQPRDTFAGVVQYDIGKTTPSGFKRTGSLNSPPHVLLSAVVKVRAKELRGRSQLSRYISKLEGIAKFQRADAGPDLLFKAAYNHERGDTCDQCSVEGRQPRPERKSGTEVMVHYGTIASGNQVMKDAAERDRVSAELGGVSCFEMEAAGLMNSFPCLVIRGISDYADSHKNDKWQPYAAGTAAAYAKELLSVIPAAEVMNTRRAEDAISSGGNIPTHSQEPLRTPLNDEQRQSLLNSLRFEQIDARQMTIKTAHTKTCRWLLKSEQYLKWLDITKLDEHHGFLWIKGKAGTGKSTLMKYALAHARKTMKDHIVLSFFFNARGEDIEKSTIGTYRSMLLQLLEHLPALQGVFNSLSLSASKLTADYQWNIETLKTLLEQAIRSLGESSVVCFIDALDECEEKQVRDMIQFFEHVGDLCMSNRIHFQVCFSSRHYPHITIRNGLELVLEGHEGHSQDITNYVETELKIGKSKIAQQVRAELQEKASGIFMWVVLVVGILNKEFDDGQVYALRQKLKAIPRDLHELFRDILTRDSHNKDRLVLCIQWVLFAKQPLSLEQLYHALLLSIDPGAILEWDPEEITKDDIKRFLLKSSKGLAEATSATQVFPFLEYATRNMLYHADAAEGGGISQAKFLDRFLDSFPLSRWVKLDNLLEKHEVRRHTERVSPLYLLAELNAANLIGVLNSASHCMDVEAERYGCPLFAAAATNSENALKVFLKYIELQQANRSFVTAVVEQQSQRKSAQRAARRRTVLWWASRNGCEASARLLLAADSVMVNSKDKDGKTPLLVAVEQGNYEVIEMLLDKGANVNAQGGQYGNTLQAALARNHEEIAMLLLDKGADVNAKGGGRYSNALQAASALGYKEIAMLLLDKGADVNAQGGYYGNALQAALAYSHKEIAMLLLDKGADVNAQGGQHGNALQAALARNHEEIAMLLLDKGADVNAQGVEYSNALQAASAYGYKEIVMLLLDKGADVNAKGGGRYSNALQAASACGHKEIAILLLDKGANVNTQGGLYSNAVQAASACGHKEIAMLLLEKGA
ncbi:hypothetical protein COCHEDRAFT_1134609 [Bipolaris maydis C5]|uniref:Uncharacterized protein n=1 Tax=Cochliobolus heterostrophus (strain C5 / ATCC 48332 / race O) TaxID=701091 RepID=M2U165_COCH5|nr:hypothetical protein COCHEDRAFT_1134609 [Bipolaris maydis C5]KAJ5022130.1 hypothetical protein J3E73DRAFT_434309 [Bipolaris maydis]KAJ6210083.1 ankyrin repeat domain-containing protein [Bipolaris maydis]KAJ6272371.1 hypothetical protein PSV08DRAFT_409124 [Bipolaris maydis]